MSEEVKDDDPRAAKAAKLNSADEDMDDDHDGKVTLLVGSDRTKFRYSSSFLVNQSDYVKALLDTQMVESQTRADIPGNGTFDLGMYDERIGRSELCSTRQYWSSDRDLPVV